MNRDNFYILLELDFDKPETDMDVINKAIKSKQEQWSKDRNHPTKGIKAQQYLSLLSEITRVMSDEKIRHTEALEAQKIIYEPLNKQIKIISQKGYVETTEIEFLAKKYKISGDVVKKRVTVEIREPKKAAQPEIPTLEAATVRKIESLLDTIKGSLNCSDLYSFLGLENGENREEIKKKAEELASEYRKKQKTAENTAASELAGICVSIIGDEKKRKSYDAYLKLQRLNDVKENIDLAAADGEISKGESTELIKQIMQKGLSVKEAEEFLISYCKGKRYFVLMPTEDEGLLNLKVCGYDGTVVDVSKGAKICPACGMPLEIECPKCKTSNETLNNNCTKCGFYIKGMGKAKEECKRAYDLISKMNFDAAEEAIKKAEKFWSDYHEIPAVKAELRQKKDLAKAYIEKIKQLVNKAEYYSAGAELAILKQKIPSFTDPALENKIAFGLQTAESWILKAKGTQNEKEIIEYCSQALKACTDYPEARTLLIKYPPLPPSGLEVTQGHNSIILKWVPGKSSGVSYKIVRKEYSAPRNENDGNTLGETDGNFFEDNDPPAGTPLYYTVLSYRGGIYSTALSNASPEYLYADVADVTAYSADGSINISWKNPVGVKYIEVWRKESEFPEAVGDGKKIDVLNNEGIADLNLKNDTAYYYTIFAAYQGERDFCFSRGFKQKCVPSVPPRPVRNITLKKAEGNAYLITWEKPNKGRVQVYYSSVPLDWQTGEVKAISAIERQLKVLPAIEKTELSTKFVMNTDGVFYLYPIIILNETGIISEAVRTANVADFTDVKTPRISGNKLYLEFTWPGKAKKALILYRDDGYAISPDDPSANKEIITQIKYSSQAAAIINGIEKKNYHITIFAVYGEAAEPVYSSGVTLLVRNEPVKEIRYSIKPEKTLWGKMKGITLTVLSNGEGVALPDLQLVKKANNLPLNKNDGTVVGVLKDVCLKDNYALTVEDKITAQKTFYKLFFVDDDNYERFKIVAPDVRSLMVGK